MSDIRTKPSMVERIARRQRPELEPEVEDRDAMDAYGEVRAPRTRGREALMIDVRKADGSCFGMSYAYMTHVDFTPGDMLRLHFSPATVQVGGRQLKPLYKRLLEHRVEAIQEGTEAEEGLKPEEAPHIDRIDIFNTSEDDYESRNPESRKARP